MSVRLASYPSILIGTRRIIVKNQHAAKETHTNIASLVMIVANNVAVIAQRSFTQLYVVERTLL